MTGFDKVPQRGDDPWPPPVEGRDPGVLSDEGLDDMFPIDGGRTVAGRRAGRGRWVLPVAGLVHGVLSGLVAAVGVLFVGVGQQWHLVAAVLAWLACLVTSAFRFPAWGWVVAFAVVWAAASWTSWMVFVAGVLGVALWAAWVRDES